MSIRSRLFATVALPVLSVSLAVQPALADSLMKPFEVAQEGSGQPSEEELLLQQRQAEEQQRAAEEQQRAAEEQQRAAEAEAQRQQQEQQAAEQQRAAEEEAARQAAEQQKAAEQEAARQAAEQEKAAEAQRAAEEEAARQQQEQQAAEQQKAAEEEAARQAAEQEKAAEAQKAAEAEAQKAADEEAARQAAEQQKAAEDEAARQAAEQEKAAEAQKAAEGEAQQKAADEQKAAEDEAARQAAEQQKAAEAEAARQAEEAKKAQTGECVVPEGQDASTACPPAGGEATTGQQPATEGQDAGEQPAVTEEQKAGEQPPATDGQNAGEAVAPAVEPQTGEPQTGEGQPVPGTEQPATAEQQPEVQPVPEIVETRTEEEKQKIADDPAASDETVVLPVENGAAVLDSDKDADNAGGNKSREDRQKLREELRAQEEAVPAPTDDASSQAQMPAEIQADLPQKIEANLAEKGTRVEEVPVFAVPETTNIVNNTIINNTVINNNTTVNNVTNNITNVEVVQEIDNRIILGVGDQIFVRGDDRPRLRRDAEETFYDQLPRGRTRETIVRPGGYRIVTIYNRYGDILQRSRVDRDGNEYLMIYAPERDEGPRPAIIDVGYELPPMRLRIPVREYIADVSEDPGRDYYDFLAEPPVERVERVYSIDEVRHSARLRDKVRRIDLDTITFPTGSAEVSMSQAKTMRGVAAAMEKVLAKDPGETFFIEGHTDAVGSDRSNLVLSDQRAESVASLLTEVYGIPAENLVTQGYGERFLKVRTEAAEQQNRRVTIRRVTPLVRPVAQR
ncbi:putative lipoprotein YiaD [Ensifer adhaerens]|uniref:OmpA family protein n=1 Tax=Ensifer adhaerens TaxID=106592 RepID=UPI001569C42F|nr:OmpA family protein [Ensifer adhaerens]NRP19211.1 putative lipoprotein YiaD [Ensifer adhaerens]